MRGEERAREQGVGSIEAGPFWPYADGCLTRSIVLNGSASDDPNASASTAITTQIPLRSHIIFHKIAEENGCYLPYYCSISESIKLASVTVVDSALHHSSTMRSRIAMAIA